MAGQGSIISAPRAGEGGRCIASHLLTKEVDKPPREPPPPLLVPLLLEHGARHGVPELGQQDLHDAAVPSRADRQGGGGGGLTERVFQRVGQHVVGTGILLGGARTCGLHRSARKKTRLRSTEAFGGDVLRSEGRVAQRSVVPPRRPQRGRWSAPMTRHGSRPSHLSSTWQDGEDPVGSCSSEEREPPVRGRGQSRASPRVDLLAISQCYGVELEEKIPKVWPPLLIAPKG